MRTINAPTARLPRHVVMQSFFLPRRLASFAMMTSSWMPGNSNSKPVSMDNPSVEEMLHAIQVEAGHERFKAIKKTFTFLDENTSVEWSDEYFAALEGFNYSFLSKPVRPEYRGNLRGQLIRLCNASESITERQTTALIMEFHGVHVYYPHHEEDP